MSEKKGDFSWMQPGVYYGHSPNGDGKPQTLFDHYYGLEEPAVARMAQEFAAAFGMGERAYLAGLLHDLGKYGDLFAARLRGEISGLDHWSAGAWAAIRKYQALDVACAVYGHHVGLPKGTLPLVELKSLTKWNEDLKRTQNRQLTEADGEALMARLREDLTAHGVALPDAVLSPMPSPAAQTSYMLATRMLFSTLVDADRLDTARHGSVGKTAEIARPEAPPLQAAKALAKVRARLAALNADDKIPSEIRELRGSLADACRTMGEGSDALLYTLTAPTGAGKTLAMLSFALEKAARSPEIFRRIVVVLPYLSILDQTIGVYRDLFPVEEFGEHYLLEHHSLANGEPAEKEGDPTDDEQDDKSRRREARMLTENWDSPIIITTSVQLMESLFANRPSACRKLHRLAGSVILCDEVQTLPLEVVLPTLKALSHLGGTQRNYKTAIVFATATQPAFARFDADVRSDPSTDGWTPTEIVPDAAKMYAKAAEMRPVTVDWSHALTPTPWGTVAAWLSQRTPPQSLAIVNLRRHAAALAQLLSERDPRNLYFLSTDLCPAHRRTVLDNIRTALDKDNPQPCRVVATQCIEAGVDISFPVLCRALAPLDALAQAMGRCNRSGEFNHAHGGGRMIIFTPPEEVNDKGERKLPYPDAIYALAAGRTESLLNDATTWGPSRMDLTNPTLFAEYYRRLYVVRDVKDERKPKALADAITALDFPKVAELYRLIENDAVNVLVPYNDDAKRLIELIQKDGLTRDRIRQARPYVVSRFRPKRGDLPRSFQPIAMMRTGAVAPDWFYLNNEREYDKDFFGLQTGESESGPPIA